MTQRRGFEFEKAGERTPPRAPLGPQSLLERADLVTVQVPARSIGREVRGAVVPKDATRESIADSEALTRELIGKPTRALSDGERFFGAFINIITRGICDLLPCSSDTVSGSLADALDTNKAGAHVYLVNPLLGFGMIPGIMPLGRSQQLAGVALITVGLEISQAERRNDLDALREIRRFLPPERGAFGVKDPTITLVLKDLDAAEAKVRKALARE